MTPAPAVRLPPPLVVPPPMPVGSVTAGALYAEPLLGRSPVDELVPEEDDPVPVDELDEPAAPPVRDAEPPLSVESPPGQRLLTPELERPAVPSDAPSDDAPSVARSGTEPCTTPVLGLRKLLLPIDGGGVISTAPTAPPIVPDRSIGLVMPMESIVSGTPLAGSPVLGKPAPVPPAAVPPGVVPAVPVPGIVVPAPAVALGIAGAVRVPGPTDLVGEVRIVRIDGDPVRPELAPALEPPRDAPVDVPPPPADPPVDCASAGAANSASANADAPIYLDRAHMTRASCNDLIFVANARPGPMFRKSRR